MDTNLFRYIWRHSRPEQMFVLVLILVSLPFYWMSLDVPKQIVNNALQGEAFKDGNQTATLFNITVPLPDALGGTLVLFEGIDYERIGYLFALSFLFLFFVVANGAIKAVINIYKGVISERVLRRMRFELFSRLMRFPPEDIRNVKPAEAATMINNELEPIGGFVGLAFIQPVFLGMQALTALAFILTQSFWLGGVALIVVTVQAIIIPYLRREQIRLGRERQIASRALAGRIGEFVQTSSLMRAYGLTDYRRAEISQRLGKLFDIRVRLFKRKFAVKYLNNLLAQITPFFFYAIGGYLALKGSLDIGQLVAVIAAYRDLPPPIKELIDWDQQRADVTVKYEQVISQFTGPGALLGDDATVRLDTNETPAIAFNSLTVLDQRKTAILSDFSANIPPGSFVRFTGTAAAAASRAAAEVLGRQTTRYDGQVTLAGHPIETIEPENFAKIAAYVPAEPQLFAGTIRENVSVALQTHRPEPGNTADTWWRETQRSGNLLLDPDADWHDYELAGLSGPHALDDAIMQALRQVGIGQDLFMLGLKSSLGSRGDNDEAARVLQARRAMRQALDDNGLSHLVCAFDPDRFNPQATLSQNLLFGVVSSDRLSGDGLAASAYFRSIVQAESLELPLIEFGLQLAENALEAFGVLPAEHPILARYALIKSSELEDIERIVAVARSQMSDIRLKPADRNRLLTLGLQYVEPKHRLGLIDDLVRARILRARRSFREYLPDEYSHEIEFYDPERVMRGAPLIDNLLFGSISTTAANAERQIQDLVVSKTTELGLDDLINALALDYNVGTDGRNLYSEQRSAIALARSLIGQHRILIIDGALQAFADEQAHDILARIRAARSNCTIIVTDRSARGTFDAVYTFDDARGRAQGAEPSHNDDHDDDTSQQTTNSETEPADRAPLAS